MEKLEAKRIEDLQAEAYTIWGSLRALAALAGKLSNEVAARTQVSADANAVFQVALSLEKQVEQLADSMDPTAIEQEMGTRARPMGVAK